MKNYNTLTTFSLALTMLLAGNFTNVLANDEIQKDLDKAAILYKTNKSDENYKVVCRREAKVGTRFKEKVCRTVSMIKTTNKSAKRKMNRVRGSPLGN